MTTRDSEPAPEDQLYDQEPDGAPAAEHRESVVAPKSQAPVLTDRDPMLDPDASIERGDLTNAGGPTDEEGVSDRATGAGRDVSRDVGLHVRVGSDALGNQGTTSGRGALADWDTVAGRDAGGDRDALGDRGVRSDQRAGEAGAGGDRSASPDPGAPTDRDVLVDNRTTNAGARTDEDAAARGDNLSAPGGLSPDVGSGAATGTGAASTGATAAGAGMERDGGPLVRPDLAMDLREQWKVIQQSFVDDPRNAVSDADALVSDVWQRLSDRFDEQQRKLKSQWHDGEPSTESLRSTLQRYRAFFHRLLDA